MTREEKRREEPPKPPKGFNAIASLLLLLCLGDWKSLTLILRPEWGPACGVEGLQLSTGAAGGQVHPALCAGEACGLLCFAFSRVTPRGTL
ncbi:hypothetical protein EMIT0P74_70289 [Pseudomonas sp. IT-P74]